MHAAAQVLANNFMRALQEDPCPICYEDLVDADLDALVWCRFGCGRNVHGKCMG